MSNDEFGDRMKMYEGVEAKRRFIPGIPIVARIDGRASIHLHQVFQGRFVKTYERVCLQQPLNWLSTQMLAWDISNPMKYL